MITGPSGRDYLIIAVIILGVGGALGIGLEHLILYLSRHLSFHIH